MGAATRRLGRKSCFVIAVRGSLRSLQSCQCGQDHSAFAQPLHGGFDQGECRVSRECLYLEMPSQIGRVSLSVLPEQILLTQHLQMFPSGRVPRIRKPQQRLRPTARRQTRPDLLRASLRVPTAVRDIAARTIGSQIPYGCAPDAASIIRISPSLRSQWWTISQRGSE